MAAWRILKENPKWRISTGVNQGKSGQKKRWSKQQGSTMNKVAPDVEDEEANYDENHGTPERPIGNKKAKALAALERKSQSRRDALGDATNKIALALDRRAKAMEDMAEIQLFSQDLSNLGETQKCYLLKKMQLAEIELDKNIRKTLSSHETVPKVSRVVEPLNSGKEKEKEKENRPFDFVDEPDNLPPDLNLPHGDQTIDLDDEPSCYKSVGVDSQGSGSKQYSNYFDYGHL
ncbi:unnamed protein product [Calypogeia fissa]